MAFSKSDLTPDVWAEVVDRLRYGWFVLRKYPCPRLDRQVRYDCMLDAVIGTVLAKRRGRIRGFGRALNLRVRRQLGKALEKERRHRHVGLYSPVVGREPEPSWRLELREARESPGVLLAAGRKLTYQPDRGCWRSKVDGKARCFGRGIPPDDVEGARQELAKLIDRLSCEKARPRPEP